MDEELKQRLNQLIKVEELKNATPPDLIVLARAVLEAIRAHIQECHYTRDGDILAIDEATEILKDYR